MSIEQKQNYLRTEIIEREISTESFFQYWQTLDLQLDDVSMDKLKEVVEEFRAQIQIHQSEHGNHSKKQEQIHQKKQEQDDEGERAHEDPIPGENQVEVEEVNVIDAPQQQEGEGNKPEEFEDQQDEFTDFQEAEPVEIEHKEPKVEEKNEYIDFNWDFLNIKKHKHHQELAETSLISSESPSRPLIESTPPKQQKLQPLKQQKKDKSKVVVKQSFEQKPQKKKVKRTENLIDELDEQPNALSRDLPHQGHPQEQKSITVKQVLDSSKLNRLKCLKLQQNVLSHHTNVQIFITNVIEAEEKNQNILNKLIKKSELVFTIKTIARNKNRSIGISWEVKRKTKDFQWLRSILVKFYPGIVVPPLPPPTSNKEKVYGYQKKLEHFLLDCCRCPELKNSTYFENFLSYSNVNDFQTFTKNSLTVSKPKSLNHIINMTGVIETLYSQNIEKYGEGLQNYISKTTNHLKQVNQILNEINDAYDTISDSYRELANVFYQMSDESHSFSNQKCYERLAQTYKQVAILTQQHSTFCEIEKDFIDAFMKSHFAYEKIRLENMQGLITKRNTFAYQLSKRPKDESGKGVFGKLTSLFGEKTEYVDTPSSNYQTLNNQVGYYNNQLLQESVRCIQVMIDSHINHFAGYGHSRVDNVDNMQKIWSKQMVELSRLGINK